MRVFCTFSLLGCWKSIDILLFKNDLLASEKTEIEQLKAARRNYFQLYFYILWLLVVDIANKKQYYCFLLLRIAKPVSLVWSFNRSKRRQRINRSARPERRNWTSWMLGNCDKWVLIFSSLMPLYCPAECNVLVYLLVFCVRLPRWFFWFL